MLASSVRSWRGPKTKPVDIAAGVRWLKDHTALPGQDVIAVTERASALDGYLIARFLEAPMMSFGSKTKFVVMPAQVGGHLKCPHICTSPGRCLEHAVSLLLWFKAIFKCIHSVQAVKKMGLRPGQQPNEVQLLTMLRCMAGLYEARTIKRLAGESSSCL